MIPKYLFIFASDIIQINSFDIYTIVISHLTKLHVFCMISDEITFLLMLYIFVRKAPISKFVGNKTKGRISKRLFQENKARQIFRKRNISYPLIHTPIRDSWFCLITDEFSETVRFVFYIKDFYDAILNLDILEQYLDCHIIYILNSVFWILILLDTHYSVLAFHWQGIVLYILLYHNHSFCYLVMDFYQHF